MKRSRYARDEDSDEGNLEAEVGDDYVPYKSVKERRRDELADLSSAGILRGRAAGINPLEVAEKRTQQQESVKEELPQVKKPLTLFSFSLSICSLSLYHSDHSLYHFVLCQFSLSLSL